MKLEGIWFEAYFLSRFKYSNFISTELQFLSGSVYTNIILQYNNIMVLFQFTGQLPLKYVFKHDLLLAFLQLQSKLWW